jgi:hypothetical protein
MFTATSINGHTIGFTGSKDTESNSNITLPWELNTGKYNTFFDVDKPYWLTFISNSELVNNKIYNNLEWRDIFTEVKEVEGVEVEKKKPFWTFDAMRVHTEHQDTGKVYFNNAIKEFTDKQPIQYNARVSNLRKKFNVWRCQISRDSIATNSKRARISNPWAYITLIKENAAKNGRHEFTDLVVDYFM